MLLKVLISSRYAVLRDTHCLSLGCQEERCDRVASPTPTCPPNSGSWKSKVVQLLLVWRRGERTLPLCARPLDPSSGPAFVLFQPAPPRTPRLQTVTPAFRAPAHERGDNASPRNTHTCRSVTSHSGSALDEHRVGGNRRRQGQGWPILPTAGFGGQACGVSLS